MISVVTLAGGRPDHLRNVVLGLSRQRHLPVELIVAVIQDTPYDLPEAPFPVRQMMVSGPHLPLAAARNAAARAAVGDELVFLDMDCIPTPDLVQDYARALREMDGLLMGEVMYLPGGATRTGWTCDDFAAVAVRHSDRRGPPPKGIERCADYRCFWSLNFAMRRTTFLSVGGFDERYAGYGGEDTDFGKVVDKAGVPIAWIKGGLAYHQYHPHHMPPVHHLDSVVRNAELFEAKWGYRTMGHWLHAFRLMGLIDDTPGQPIRILRRPDKDDLALTGQQSHQPYANTASVIRLLEERTASGRAAA
ncbi:galactosyltransferase-related protein [Sphingomonas sp.]|uniref:glycosyltransferase family 2 protein n=1 Tax=Sphingomonas sp. TaxID=28214 RepID=UPI0031E15383